MYGKLPVKATPPTTSADRAGRRGNKKPGGGGRNRREGGQQVVEGLLHGIAHLSVVVTAGQRSALGAFGKMVVWSRAPVEGLAAPP